MNISAKYINPAVIQDKDNACGAFALGSVLPDAAHPSVIYSEIQAKQKAYTGDRQGYLASTAGNDGSYRSLPSAIVAVAKDHKCKNIKLCCAGNTLKGVFGNSIYSSEITGILSLGATISANEAGGYAPPTKGGVVHVVLVDNGAHWVSVDDKSAYDPGRGGVTRGSISGRYFHLYIELF
jgi:hypothetical protein